MLSPLEVIHPLGYVRHGVALGSGAPEALLPAPNSQRSGPSDLVVICPGDADRGGSDWVEQVAETADRMLAPEGLLYIAAGAWPRRLLAHSLRQRGFQIGPPMIHLPDITSSRYVVPMTPAGIRCAASLARTGRWRAAAAESLAMLARFPKFAAAAPCIGIAATRAGGPPPFHWMATAETGEALQAVVRSSWRASGPATVHTVVEGAEANSRALFAKMWPAGAPVECAASEADALRRLAPSARAAGAEVPALMGARMVGDHPVLIRTALQGTPAAAILTHRPNRMAGLLGRVALWLSNWNRRSLYVDPEGSAPLQRELLGLLDTVSPHIEDPAEYGAWLMAMCKPDLQHPALRVHCHNDLTAWNVLVSNNSPLGVIDWESARHDGYPYTDLAYAAVDFVAAMNDYRDRFQAFCECFSPGGEHHALIGVQLSKFRQSLVPSAAIDQAYFHCCWLHHAANELKETAGGPFLKIAQWMAANRNVIGGAMERLC